MWQIVRSRKIRQPKTEVLYLLMVYESVVIGSQATISGSTFSMNSAGDSGGGIANYYGTLIVDHSFLHANKSLDIGGWH